MDLVDFDRDVFDGISDEFERDPARRAAATPFRSARCTATTSSRAASARRGSTGRRLLEFLETVEVERDTPALPFRFPVQLVVRPNDEFRGYAGQIASGTVRVGDTVHGVAVGPHRRASSASSPTTASSTMAFAPMSVTLTLDDEIDISRGDVIATSSRRWSGSGSRPRWCGWTSGRSIPARVYLLKQRTRTVTAEIDHGLVLNQIGTVTVSTARPLVFDRYDDNRGTGSFILIDPATNFTAGRRHDRRTPRARRRDDRGGAGERRRTAGAARPARRLRCRSRGGRPQGARGDAGVIGNPC